jgi:hypothetical protein
MASPGRPAPLVTQVTKSCVLATPRADAVLLGSQPAHQTRQEDESYMDEGCTL